MAKDQNILQAIGRIKWDYVIWDYFHAQSHKLSAHSIIYSSILNFENVVAHLILYLCKYKPTTNCGGHRLRNSIYKMCPYDAVSIENK